MRKGSRTPAIKFFHLCEKVEHREDGRLTFHGVFDSISTDAFPAEVQFSIVAGLSLPTANKCTIQLRLIRPDERSVLSPPIHSDRRNFIGIYEFSNQFTHPGDYRWELIVDGKTVSSYDLTVIQSSAASTKSEIAVTFE